MAYSINQTTEYDLRKGWLFFGKDFDSVAEMQGIENV